MTWLVYDFFDSATAGQAWRSSNGLAPPLFVKALAVDLPQKFSSIKCNEWGTEDYIGGIRVSEGKTCVFRICNGGRDCHGRPNRWVLLLALADSATWRGTDVIAAVESPMFSSYAIAPVPSPAPLPVAEPSWPLQSAGSIRATSDSFAAEGKDAEARARECSLRLTTGGATAGLIIVQRQASQVKTWFKLEGKKYAPPAPIVARLPARLAPDAANMGFPRPDHALSNSRDARSPTSNLKWIFFSLGLLLGLILGVAVGKVLWDKPQPEPSIFPQASDTASISTKRPPQTSDGPPGNASISPLKEETVKQSGNRTR